MSIMLNKADTGYDSIILNEFGLVLNQVAYIPEDERDLFDGDKESVRQVGVRYKNLDMMVALFHALSNMRKHNIDLKSPLYSCGPYIIAKTIHGQKVVGYLEMNTYTTAAYEYIHCIGTTVNYSRERLSSFPLPLEEDDEPALSFDELHPKRPTGYEGRAY